MTKLQELAEDNNLLVLVPMRSGQRLYQNDVCYPSHSFIPLQQPGLIGRPQLLSCLYAACGCDENKMIGSSQNKCSECQEITKALGSYMSRQALEIIIGNNIRCRGGRNASVSVGSVQVSSNESWSEQIQLRNGMVVSFATNFQSKRRQDDSIQLSFEVFSVPAAPQHHESCPQDGRETKRPLEQSVATLPPNKVPKSADPKERKNNSKENHKGSLQHRAAGSLPMADTRSCKPPPPNPPLEKKDKASKTCLLVSTSYLRDANSDMNLAAASLFERVGAGPMTKQKNDPDSNIDLRTGKKQNGLHAAEPTLNERAHPSDKQMTNISYGRDTCVATEVQVADPISDTFNSSSDMFQPRFFFCPLGQDMSKGLIAALSGSVAKIGGIVVDRLEASTYMVVSSSVSSWEKVAKRLGMEEKKLRSLLSSVRVLYAAHRFVTLVI
ncbi:MAG: hypothetical protein SGBAC_011238 [Bacillariaceae sp.]